MKVALMAAGTWGITLASLLHQKGVGVRVWEIDEKLVETLVSTRRHPRLPHLELPEGLSISSDLKSTLSGSEVITLVVPAVYLRETCRQIVKVGYTGQMVVICSKGIEQGSHLLLKDVAEEEFGPQSKGLIGVLSGPSHAEEVSRKLPTALTAASEEIATAEKIRDLFITPEFRVYTQTDVKGVELAASLKNVIAIACGASDGLGFGDNSKAALITRGLSEILRLGVAMGAKQETFFGLAGLGDLVVTCMSRHSRNWRFGSLLGQGYSTEEALKEVGMVVEGYYTVQTAVELAGIKGVEMPISETVADVVYHGKKVREAVPALMEREPKSEMDQ